MDLPELPQPPDPEELLREFDAVGDLSWSQLFHLAATRGSLEDPGPLLWVDALREIGEWGATGRGGPETRAQFRTRVARCLFHLGRLPVLPLETKWLRRMPREDSSLVYTGSLVDVMTAGTLEDAAIGFSRLLRTVGSYDYARELIRDAAAWDLRDSSGLGLRCAHAAARSAGWEEEDPAERERARAILVRWFGFLYRRRPTLPSRPPRGESAVFPVKETLSAWVWTGEGSDRPEPRPAGSSLGGPVSPEALSLLATLGRVQEDTRVLGRSLHDAWKKRWNDFAGASPDEVGRVGANQAPGDRLPDLGLDPVLRADLLAADLGWVAATVSPSVASRLERRLEAAE